MEPSLIFDYREFLKENDHKVYDFCFYMLNGGYVSEEMVLDAIEAFGTDVRKRPPETSELARIKLFRLAWDRVRQAQRRLPAKWIDGRDTRVLKDIDEDLLSRWAKEKSSSGFETILVERLGQVSLDFRAPLVLKDVLHFDDEAVIQILAIRWGVFRHRLHRGRLEFLSLLRGNAENSKYSKRRGAELAPA